MCDGLNAPELQGANSPVLGVRGRRFKSGRPDAGQEANSDFRVGLLSYLGPRSNARGAFWPFLTAGQVCHHADEARSSASP